MVCCEIAISDPPRAKVGRHCAHGALPHSLGYCVLTGFLVPSPPSHQMRDPEAVP